MRITEAKLTRYYSLLRGVIDCALLFPTALLVASFIRVLPPRWTIALSRALQRMTSCVPITSNNPISAYQRWVRALHRTKKYLLLPLSCLGESIILRTYLRLSGIPSEIRLGIRENLGSLEAHAWIELPGIENTKKISEQYNQFSSHPFSSSRYRR
jgi:hypothetical protein